MDKNILIAIIGIAGVIVGSIITYLTNRNKVRAEINNLKSQATVAKIEAKKLSKEFEIERLSNIKTLVDEQSDELKKLKSIELTENYSERIKNIENTIEACESLILKRKIDILK